MSATPGNMQSVGVFGWWVSEGASPAAPTIASVADGGDGATGTASITGVVGECRVYTKVTTATTWTLQDTISADGDAALSGLSPGTYDVMAINLSGGALSLPCVTRLVIAIASGAVTASGPFALPLENLRTLVANATAFQTWTGTANATEAKTHIYLAAVDAPTAKRPFALARYAIPADWERHVESGGDRNHFTEGGAIELLFEDDVAAAHRSDSEKAELQFLNDVGGIVSDMEELAGSGTYLHLRRISVSQGPGRSHPKEAESRGTLYQVLFRVEYGVYGT